MSISSIMPETTVLLANTINGVGVVGLIISHFLVAQSKMTQGFVFSLAGGALVATGSALLLSWPVVFLNVVWALIALLGLVRSKSPITQPASPSSMASLLLLCIYMLVFLYFSLFYSFIGHEFSGWVATGFYVSSFILLSLGIFQSRHYLFVCLLGYFLLIVHLILTNNYAVLLNETIGALIGIWGVGAYYWKKLFTSNDPAINI